MTFHYLTLLGLIHVALGAYQQLTTPLCADTSGNTDSRTVCTDLTTRYGSCGNANPNLINLAEYCEHTWGLKAHAASRDTRLYEVCKDTCTSLDCFESNSDLVGNDISAESDVASAAACQAKCKAMSNCKYFSYKGWVKQCLYKTSEEGRQYVTTDIISGPAECTVDEVFATAGKGYNTYDFGRNTSGGCRDDSGAYGNYLATRHVTAKQCQETCDALGAKCDAYTLNMYQKTNYYCAIWCQTCTSADIPKNFKPFYKPDFDYGQNGPWQIGTTGTGGPVTKAYGSGGNYCHMRTKTILATTPAPSPRPLRYWRIGTGSCLRENTSGTTLADWQLPECYLQRENMDTPECKAMCDKHDDCTGFDFNGICHLFHKKGTPPTWMSSWAMKCQNSDKDDNISAVNGYNGACYRKDIGDGFTPYAPFGVKPLSTTTKVLNGYLEPHHWLHDSNGVASLAACVALVRQASDKDCPDKRYIGYNTASKGCMCTWDVVVGKIESFKPRPQYVPNSGTHTYQIGEKITLTVPAPTPAPTVQISNVEYHQLGQGACATKNTQMAQKLPHCWSRTMGWNECKTTCDQHTDCIAYTDYGGHCILYHKTGNPPIWMKDWARVGLCHNGDQDDTINAVTGSNGSCYRKKLNDGFRPQEPFNLQDWTLKQITPKYLFNGYFEPHNWVSQKASSLSACVALVWQESRCVDKRYAGYGSSGYCMCTWAKIVGKAASTHPQHVPNNGLQWYEIATATTPSPTNTPAPTPILPIITDVKSCWCKEDPHCVGLADSELFHFPKIGDFSFYKNSNIEIRTRQEKPTNRPKVIVISGVVFKGKWTCGQKIEITRGAWGTYSTHDDKQSYKESYKPVLAVDGSKTEGAGNIITKLTSLFGSCNFITFSVRSGDQRTLDFKFPDDTRLAIQRWMYFPGFGTTVALNLHKNHYDAAADTGVCLSKSSQASTCSENMFTQFQSCVE